LLVVGLSLASHDHVSGMNIYQALNNLYGQLRGYDRRRIRREAAQNARRSFEEMKKITAELFRLRVCEAVERFPAYAEKVRAFRGSLPGRDEVFGPEELPVWTRDDQREHFRSQDGPPLESSFVNATGGSTGVPLQYWVTRRAWEWRRAVSDRGYSWAGAEEGRRSLYVWGTAIHAPGKLKSLIAGIQHRLQKRTFFDSFHFGDEQRQLCCRAINRIKPFSLVGYTGNLVELAGYVRSHPAELTWRSKSILTAAEGLSSAQRSLLQERLGDQVFLTYGSREFMLMGSECHQHCGYHVSSDNVMIEVADTAGRPAAAGEPGRILVTDLRNSANPFVRYEIGDGGVMAPDEPCRCGLPFPLLAAVEGRTQEMIRLPGGGKLTALFIPHLMKEFGWVEGYQVYQEKEDEIRVTLVTGRDITPELTAPIENALRAKVGPAMRIGFERVDRLVRNRAFKIPIVVTPDTARESREHPLEATRSV